MLLVAIVDQRIEAGHRFDPHVAAAAAVAAVRAAELDELLAPETGAAVAAVAGADINLGLIEEAHSDIVSKIAVPVRPLSGDYRRGGSVETEASTGRFEPRPDPVFQYLLETAIQGAITASLIEAPFPLLRPFDPFWAPEKSPDGDRKSVV